MVQPFLRKPRNLLRIQLVFRSPNPYPSIYRCRKSILRMSVQSESGLVPKDFNGFSCSFCASPHYPCLRALALERRPLWLSLFRAHQELHRSETAYQISDPEKQYYVLSDLNVKADFVWPNEWFLNQDRPQIPFQQYLCNKVLFRWRIQWDNVRYIS